MSGYALFAVIVAPRSWRLSPVAKKMSTAHQFWAAGGSSPRNPLLPRHSALRHRLPPFVADGFQPERVAGIEVGWCPVAVVLQFDVNVGDTGQRVEYFAGADDERGAHHAARLGEPDTYPYRRPAGSLAHRYLAHQAHLRQACGCSGDHAARIDDCVEVRADLFGGHAVTAFAVHGSASSPRSKGVTFRSRMRAMLPPRMAAFSFGVSGCRPYPSIISWGS